LFYVGNHVLNRNEKVLAAKTFYNIRKTLKPCLLVKKVLGLQPLAKLFRPYGYMKSCLCVNQGDTKITRLFNPVRSFRPYVTPPPAAIPTFNIMPLYVGDCLTQSWLIELQCTSLSTTVTTVRH